MANAWSEHVKKTMSEMKASAKDGKVMLKDVLKAAGKTYKKVVNPIMGKNKTHKKGKKGKKGRRKSEKKRR